MRLPFYTFTSLYVCGTCLYIYMFIFLHVYLFRGLYAWHFICFQVYTFTCLYAHGFIALLVYTFFCFVSLQHYGHVGLYTNRFIHLQFCMFTSLYANGFIDLWVYTFYLPKFNKNKSLQFMKCMSGKKTVACKKLLTGSILTGCKNELN